MTFKICKTCGNEILNGNYKYCSDGCKPSPEAIKKYYKAVAFKDIICFTCGKEFKSKMKKRKYCGPICKRVAQKERNRLLTAISKKKICPKCAEEFMGPGKHCSPKCYLERNISISPDGILLKQCPKCVQIKPLNEENYYREKTSLNGFSTYCKICEVEKTKQWAASDRGKILRKATNQRNIETTRKYNKKKAPERRANETIRRKTDLPFALSNRMRCLMYTSLRQVKNGRKWQELTGYSLDDLRRHIEKQFKKGMTWERFLAGEIHIDHKIPVSAFNFDSPDHIDFKRCWALKNLQPMWANDNQVKHAKLEKHFQPSLLLRARI